MEAAVEHCRWREELWRGASARNAGIAKALELAAEVNDLGRLLDAGWKEARFIQRFKALRRLFRRFGKFGTRYVIGLASPVSSNEFRLELRPREARNQTDRGLSQKRVQLEIKDSVFLTAVYKHRAAGLPEDEALLAAAIEVRGGISNGVAGARKSLGRAQKASRARGYVDPLAPIHAYVTGQALQKPIVDVGDLRSRGRPPKKKDK